MIAVARDHAFDECGPLLHREGGEIGLAEAVEILAAHLAAMLHGRLLVRGRVDHAFPPVADVLAEPAAEPLAACVAPGVGRAVGGVEPAMVAGLAVADGAEAGCGWRMLRTCIRRLR